MPTRHGCSGLSINVSYSVCTLSNTTGGVRKIWSGILVLLIEEVTRAVVEKVLYEVEVGPVVVCFGGECTF